MTKTILYAVADKQEEGNYSITESTALHINNSIPNMFVPAIGLFAIVDTDINNPDYRVIKLTIEEVDVSALTADDLTRIEGISDDYESFAAYFTNFMETRKRILEASDELREVKDLFDEVKRDAENEHTNL